MSDISIAEALKKGRDFLKKAGVDSFQLDARYLLKEALDADEATLISQADTIINSNSLKQYFSFITARSSRKPVSKILGKKEFWGLEFEVNEHVLDPRPDTEILIQKVLDFATSYHNGPLSILDLGTGSGCIPVTLATVLSKAKFVAVDISDKALDVAKRNASKHGVEDRVSFVKSRWAQNISGSFDIVISNPPYIDSRSCENLMPEVRNHDPILALDGGSDGNDAYREIFSQIFPHINPQGTLFLEIDSSNLSEIRRLCEISGVELDSVFQDYGHRDRVVKIVHGEKTDF